MEAKEGESQQLISSFERGWKTVAGLLRFHQITVVFHERSQANETDETATTMGLAINFVILDTCCYVKESTNCFRTKVFPFQLLTKGCFQVQERSNLAGSVLLNVLQISLSICYDLRHVI